MIIFSTLFHDDGGGEQIGCRKCIEHGILDDVFKAHGSILTVIDQLEMENQR